MLHQHWTVRRDWFTWLNGLSWAQGELAAEREDKKVEAEYFRVGQS